METQQTSRRNGAWVWGILLILLGVAFIVNNLVGWMGQAIWATIMGGIAVTFTAVYLANRDTNWWALIPAYVFAGITAIIVLSSILFGEWMAVFVLMAVAVPFYYVFARNRKNWWAIIPAALLTAAAGLTLLAGVLPDAWFAALFPAAAAIPFLIVFARNRSQHWWALIPAYVFIAAASIVVVSGVLPGEWIASFVMGLLTLPFLVTWATNPRERWWALIPAYVFAVTGVFVPFGPVQHGDWPAVYWTLAVALPFYVVFVTNRRNWWALIPAGIMTAIAAGFLISVVDFVFPVALIAGGLFLLGWQFTRRQPARVAERPLYGPEADKPLPGFEPMGTREPEPEPVATGPEADHI